MSQHDTPDRDALIRQAQEALNVDASLAATLSAELRDRFPDHAAGYRLGALCERRRGRLDVARAILDAAILRFPAQVWPLAEAATTARERGDNDEVCQLADMLRERFPDHPAGYQAGAFGARKQRRLDESAALIAEGEARFPSLPWPLIERIWLANSAGDKDEAIRLAGELRRRYPGARDGYKTGAELLHTVNRLDEATSLLAEAAGRFPNESWIRTAQEAVSRTRRHRERAARLIAALPGRPAPDLDKTAPAPAEAGTGTVPGDRTVIVVLGRHRSGTSLCTRILQKLGVALGGPLMEPGPGNTDGFQEHLTIVNRHNDLLAAFDLSWDASWLAEPPPASVWSGDAVAGARRELERLVVDELAASGGVWAFKDPRTAHFLPMWQEMFAELGVRVVWVLSVREPHAVARSLASRDGLPLALGELLWTEHNLDILRHLGPRIGCIVQFDAWFDQPIDQIRRLAAAIGGVDEAAIETAARSIRRDLRHNAPDRIAADTPEAAEVYRWLTTPIDGLARVQRQAEAMWRGIAAVAADLDRAPGHDPAEGGPRHDDGVS